MLLDLPGVVDGDRQVVPPALARRADERAHVRLGAAAVVVDDVQHAPPRRGGHGEAHRGGLPQRAQGVGGDVGAHHVEVVRVARHQQGHVARPELALLPGERAAARVHDERVVGEHVAPAGARGLQAQVVLLAVAQPERGVEAADFVEQRAAHVHAEAHARRQVRIGGHRRPGQCGAHRLGIRTRRPRVVRAEARERADLRVVRERRDRARARVGGGTVHDRVEPAGGDDRVRVEQHDVRARQLHAAVRRAGEALVALVGEQDDLRVRALREQGEVRGDPRVG